MTMLLSRCVSYDSHDAVITVAYSSTVDTRTVHAGRLQLQADWLNPYFTKQAFPST
jgi:hypothetical protein